MSSTLVNVLAPDGSPRRAAVLAQAAPGTATTGGTMSLGLDGRVDALFGQAGALVYRTAWRITGSRQDAEDVLQSVFLRLLEGGASDTWPDDAVAYVHRAAVNASLDLVRRRRRWPTDPADDRHLPPRSAAEPDAVRQLDARLLAERLRRCLTLLTPLEAEVFVLRAVEDLGNAEIAAMLGKTANHVGVVLHAARCKLRDALASGEHGGEAAANAPPTPDTTGDRSFTAPPFGAPVQETPHES